MKIQDGETFYTYDWMGAAWKLTEFEAQPVGNGWWLGDGVEFLPGIRAAYAARTPAEAHKNAVLRLEDEIRRSTATLAREREVLERSQELLRALRAVEGLAGAVLGES